MNVDIQDRSIFDTFEPNVLIRYVRAHGWKEIKRIPSEVVIFELDKNDKEPYRIWIPLSREFSDFASVMSSAFKTISEAEENSQLITLDDLQTISIGDVIRIGSEDSLDRADHTLRLTDGIKLHEQAKELVLAGAWNAISGNYKKPVYPQDPKIEISRYMQKVRLAQTERGSYVVRLISPIREDVLNQMPLSPDIPTSSPFERQAVVEMLGGLNGLKYASEYVNRRGKFYFPVFEESVQDGVSANLCDAIAPAINNQSGNRPIWVSVSWCDIIPTPDFGVNENRVEFDLPLLPFIREASKEFRKRNPEEIIIRGAVTDLHRPGKKSSGAGEVRIYGMVNERARYVKVALMQEDYELAVDAHKTYKEVSVRGILVPKPSIYVLDKPSNFHIITDIPLHEE